MNDAVVSLITTGLSTTLMHPGDEKTPAFPLPLQMFRTSSLPQEQRDMYAQEAGLPHSDVPRLVAEALTALIEGQYDLVPKAETAQMRAAAAAAEPMRTQEINLSCRMCRTHLLTATVNDFDTANPTIPGPVVIGYMRSLSPECALGHKVVA